MKSVAYDRRQDAAPRQFSEGLAGERLSARHYGREAVLGAGLMERWDQALLIGTEVRTVTLRGAASKTCRTAAAARVQVGVWPASLAVGTRMKDPLHVTGLTSSLTSYGADSGAHGRTVADAPEVKTAMTDVDGRLRTAPPEPPFEGSNPSAPAF